MTLTGLKRVFGLSTLLCAAALLAGCYHTPNPPEPIFPPTAPGGEPGFAFLRVGDLITVSFSDVGPAFMREQQVRIPDDGIITLPHNVRVKASGKTTSQLEKDIREAYVPAYYVSLTASVRAEERWFIVDGEVRKPGQHPYSSEMTVLRAIGSAGGFTEFANRKKIQLRRQSGEIFFINYPKAIKKPELDLPVYPNDHIIIDKSIF